MVNELQPALTAHNGHTLRVLVPCRVSNPGPGKQDIRSLADQEALHRRWLDEHTSLPVDVTVVAGSGSGECLERAEYLRTMDLVESGHFDLVLTEDLGRIVRRIHAHLFCELCVDHGVRLIALNDHIDTWESGWQDRSIFSAWHHERSNRDTSDRIKRTHRSRFTQGHCLSLPIFGYRKQPGAKSDADLEKIPDAAPIYKEWFERLEKGEHYSEIADWLNANNVSPGPYARKPKWDGTMVGAVSHNILLKGYRYRNKRKTARNNTSGRYKSQKADPKDLLLRHVPHLAFFEEAYYDRVIADVDARNAIYRRNGKDKRNWDPCQNRPKKRTRFPGQTIYCGVCGRLYVFGGHGQKDHLMCDGARGYKCWNGITVDGPLATAKIADAVFAEIQALEDFDTAFLGMVNDDARRLDASRNHRLQEIRRELHAVRQEIENLMTFIRGGDSSDHVRRELHCLEEDREKPLVREQEKLNRMPRHVIELPSAVEIKATAGEAFRDLAMDSFEYAKRMRMVTGKIYVYPFRLCEGRPLVLRAKLRLALANLLPDEGLREVLQRPLERVLRIDLFNAPQRVAFCEKVSSARQEVDASGRKRRERDVAASLGITVAAAQRAAALDRLMKQQGLPDPYVRLLEPPSDYPKLRRHHHPRYRFESLPGHIPDW